MHASIVAQLVDNMLCGYRFAGLARILAIASSASSKQERKPLAVVHETPLSALIDGGNNVAYITAFSAAELVIEKARKHDIASVGAFNSYFSGRNAYFVEKVVNAGLVCMHVASATPRAVPPGATRPALGTNPICFGFPSRRGPVIVDMGTAALMWGDVMLHAHTGEPLPPGVAVDEHGHPTTDAVAALRGGVTTFGGHKGYALSFAVQAMGLLAGAARARGAVQDFGFLFWALDPELMLPGDFQRQMGELLEKMKATPRPPDVDEIRIPSERAFREHAVRRREGIVIERKVVESLRAL